LWFVVRSGNGEILLPDFFLTIVLKEFFEMLGFLNKSNLKKKGRKLLNLRPITSIRWVAPLHCPVLQIKAKVFIHANN